MAMGKQQFKCLAIVPGHSTMCLFLLSYFKNYILLSFDHYLAQNSHQQWPANAEACLTTRRFKKLCLLLTTLMVRFMPGKGGLFTQFSGR